VSVTDTFGQKFLHSVPFPFNSADTKAKMASYLLAVRTKQTVREYGKGEENGKKKWRRTNEMRQ